MTELTDRRKMTQEELDELAVERFGPDPRWFTFGCPSCGALADAGDFLLAGADPNRIGVECIGRHLGALGGGPTTDGGRRRATRGCNWTAYGLISGPWSITVPARDVLSYKVDPTAPTKTVPGFALSLTPRDAERTDEERAAVRAAWDARRAERGPIHDGAETAPIVDGPTGTEVSA